MALLGVGLLKAIHRKRIMKNSIITACVLSLFVAAGVRAEDINEIFKRVNQFIENKNYARAMEELDWAKKEIEKMHITKLEEFFPDSLAGFKGEKFDTNSVLGFTNIERDYTQGKKKVKVSLTGGTGQGGAALSGLAQLGKMAAMFGGGGNGSETLRVKGRTAMSESTGAVSSLTVILDSGSMLRLDSSDGMKSEELKSMAEAIKVDELDTYLKGGQ